MFNINLIPWRAQLRRLKWRYLAILIFVATAILLLGLWGGEVFLTHAIRQTRGEIKRIENDLQQLKQKDILEKEKIQKIEMIKSANMLMKLIKLNNKKVCQQVTELVSQVPNAIRLLELNYSHQKWSLEGVATDKNVLLSFAKKVQAQEVFNRYQFRKWEVRDEGINFLFKEDM